MPVVFAVAIVNVVRDDVPSGRVTPVLVALITVVIAVVVSPVAEAAASRAGERAADTNAAGLVVGPDLAVALHQVSPCRPGTLIGRVRNTHPPIDVRQRRLIGAVPLWVTDAPILRTMRRSRPDGTEGSNSTSRRAVKHN